MQQKQILIDGSILSYIQYGAIKTDTLLFLHGWMQNKDSFESIFKILEQKNISYISLDLPGFWGSWLIHDAMTIEEYGHVVQEFIEKKNLTNPILVWHSFWGRISVYLWSFYENISKIILIGAAGIAPKMNPLYLLIVKTGKYLTNLPWLKYIWAQLKSRVSGADYKGAGNMIQIYKNTISNDLQEYMRQISFPTLMIWGKDDDQVPLSEANIMKNTIKNSELHILDGSHFIHQENPQKCSELILDFIN